MNKLKDRFGRTFPYIRLSISDVCNFKCGYCLPNGYQTDKSDNRTFINIEEIRRLAWTEKRESNEDYEVVLFLASWEYNDRLNIPNRAGRERL